MNGWQWILKFFEMTIKIQLTESSLTTVSIFLKVGSVSMLTTIISSGIVKNTNNQSLIYAIISHPGRENDGKKCICGLVHACCWPVVGLLVWAPEDELAQAGHSVRAHQSVAAKSPAVHHSDVERRVKQLVLRKILTPVHRKTVLLNSSFCNWCKWNWVWWAIEWWHTTSNHLTRLLKLGFFLKLGMRADCTPFPAHSISTRGRSTWARFTLFRSLKPQNRTCRMSKLDGFILFLCQWLNKAALLHLYLNPVFAEDWPDPQRHWQDGTTIHICGTIYRREVSLPIWSNLRDETRKRWLANHPTVHGKWTGVTCSSSKAARSSPAQQFPR